MEEESISKLPENKLVRAVNFVLQKFLVQAGTIEAEGKILEKQLVDLENRVQIKKMNTIIQNSKNNI